jgi:hypothetical protein
VSAWVGAHGILEPSCLAWPAGGERWYVWQRATGDEFRIESPAATGEVLLGPAAARAGTPELATLVSRLAELGILANGEASWRPVAPAAGVVEPTSAAGIDAVVADSGFGDEVARALAALSGGADPVRCPADEPERVEGGSVVVATAAYRPRLLRAVAARADRVLAAFHHGPYVIAGPWLREPPQCPCPRCLHMRLGAAARHPETFEARWRAAESTPETFARRLPSGAEARAVAAAVARFAAEPDEDGASIRIDLRDGSVSRPTLLAVPRHAEPVPPR